MFKRSSFCNWEPPQCAEVDGLDTDTVTVRSSVTNLKVQFDREEWAAFVEGMKAGEFDLLPLPEMATARA